ncbi:hypothetical protein GQ43DRAFT_437355 [Delitschia confertaspora ATCC 74209]|uniref:Oxidoreductase, short chain dehydrogenase/reductase family protein n=1 Tax=Delitschia confertaspora ATCC 74209 TaxID=1513339 RepID=A0A9P4JT75_9PLEO|nr:hypothetical protein GQ43DRAFT_437355 [Delitschia confertaspora ATCC 74209]
MVNLKTVQTHNASLKTLAPGLVAVFVGGTSGIGLSTAREFVRNTRSPHVYLIGRNEAEANKLISELGILNPESQTTFIKSDISLLKNVDKACQEISAKEKKVNLLFMTAGYFTFNGRQETSEGLDQKFSLHYYARARFIKNLLPLLDTAANNRDENANLSRVVSVLDPHASVRALGAGALNYSDLSLKNSFSLKNCAAHASAMNNFYMEKLAKSHPGTSFIHAYPSAVKTGVARGLDPISSKVWVALTSLMKPFMVDLGESGERHLYASTAKVFAAMKETADYAAVGSDGTKGSGSYWLNWDDDVLPFSKKLAKLREEGAGEKIVQHTEEVFKKVCEEKQTYP